MLMMESRGRGFAWSRLLRELLDDSAFHGVAPGDGVLWFVVVRGALSLAVLRAMACRVVA